MLVSGRPQIVAAENHVMKSLVAAVIAKIRYSSDL